MKSVLIYIAVLLAWAGEGQANRSVFRLGQPKVKGDSLELPVVIDHHGPTQAKIDFYAHSALPGHGSAVWGPKNAPKVETGLVAGNCTVGSGACTQQLKLSLKQLKSKAGVGPGDTLFIAATFKIGGLTHWWGVNAGASWPGHHAGTSVVIPATKKASQNSALLKRARGRAGSVMRRAASARWPRPTLGQRVWRARPAKLRR